MLAGACILALGTGLATFDWTWSVAFPLREKLFVIHRAAGMVTLIVAIVWLLRYRAHSRGSGREVRSLAVRLYHLGLAVMAAVLAMFGWVGRALDGRWAELFSPLPPYNFVSRPDVPLAHRLLSTHATLANVLLIAVAVHVTFAAAHWAYGRRSANGQA